MTVEELSPYVGMACLVRFRCRRCGGAHLLPGIPQFGRYAGDVVLRGHTFTVEDIEQVWRDTQPPRRRQGLGLWLRSVLPRGQRRRTAASLTENP